MTNETNDLSKIEQMVRQNLSVTREVLESVEKIRRYILWIKILNIIKLVLILLPIILALIFLPPLLGQVFKQYGDVLGQVKQLQQGNLNSFDPNALKGLLGR